MSLIGANVIGLENSNDMNEFMVLLSRLELSQLEVAGLSISAIGDI